MIEYDSIQGKGGNCKEFCSLSCVSIYHNRKIHERKTKEYYQNPLSCINCETIIPYEKRYDANKFCNNKCYIEYKVNKNLKDGVTDGPHCKVTFHICQVTKKPYLATNPNGPGWKRSPYIRTDLEKYINDSQFQFNIYDYPNYFDLGLTDKYGWYHPIENKNGVSRDHMFSIMEGFRQKIKPEFIAHPANCELLIHRNNIIKRDQCSITIEGLISRIEHWIIT